MNRLSTEKRVQILGLMVEGMGVRAIARLADVSPVTVLKFVSDMGDACSAYQDRVIRNLKCKRIQVDEIWQFCYAKQKNASEKMKAIGAAGDVWTWTAIDADTKLIVSYLIGARDAEYANEFIADLKSRLANRVQLTSDGLKAYIEAVDNNFGADVDYAQLVKMYGNTPENLTHRYSPAECTGARKETITGEPATKHISTSYVERQNLSMRMHMRRFTRLTNGFSKKIENHEHAIAIYFMYYNFGRVHNSLRITPAMEAGIAKHIWTLEDIVKLAD